jgi:PemK-like, MazF-like toxin of type II toxin-antitoxin system
VTFNPGEVVTVDFPGVMGIKRRPAVVLSSATYHATRPANVIVGLITTQTTDLGATDCTLQDWAAAGLPERIGLKPLPCREKLKSDYSLIQSSSFQVEVALKRSTVNCQLSTEGLHPFSAASSSLYHRLLTWFGLGIYQIVIGKMFVRA